jgi:hypothetical protein
MSSLSSLTSVSSPDVNTPLSSKSLTVSNAVYFNGSNNYIWKNPEFSTNVEIASSSGINLITTGTSRVLINGSQVLYANSGITSNRPSINVPVGFPYFDTTLGYTVWWNGSNWVNSLGGVV